MNYQRIYSEFISDRILKQDNIVGYYEKHHILPKSLGGDNSSKNIVKLTANDHFFAHTLLAKIHGGPMWRAYWMMSNSKKYKKSRILYSEAKIYQADHMSKISGFANKGRVKKPEEIEKIRQGLINYFKNNSQRPKKRELTDEEKLLASKKTKDWLRKNGHPLLGTKRSKESIEKCRAYMLSEKNHIRGKKMSDDHKNKIRKAQLGSLNHSYKHQVYIFNHPEHGEFKGTQNQLMKEFGLKKCGVSRLCLFKYKQHLNWRIKEVLSNDN